MADRAATASAPPGTTEAVAATVAPIKAGGALLGFAVGFLATWRMQGGFAAAVLHGLLGALLVAPIAWFFALVLLREAIRANVERQRREHDARVAQTKRQVAQQLVSAGMPLPPALAEHAPTLVERR